MYYWPFLITVKQSEFNFMYVIRDSTEMTCTETVRPATFIVVPLPFHWHPLQLHQSLWSIVVLMQIAKNGRFGYQRTTQTSMTDTDSKSAAAIMFYFALRHEAD